MRSAQKTRGEKMKVTSIMLLKTNIEKMPEFRLSIILMKQKKLKPSFHYVDEKKWSYKCRDSGFGIGDLG